MEKSFSTLEELQAEIGVLKIRRSEQELVIQEKFNGPMSIFKTVGSLFRVGDGKSGEGQGIYHQDIVTLFSRILLPVILNSSLFRGSNFITKGLVTMFSQKAAKNINIDVVTSFVDKVASIFKKRAENSKKDPDYGIPPDSETY